MTDPCEPSGESHVMVTGATSGIGLATVEQLAKDRSLIVCARSEAKASQIVAGLPQHGSHKIWIHDLSDPAGIESSLITFLNRTNAVVSGFVHAAGVLEVQPARNLTVDSITRQFRVNVFSGIEIMRNLVRPKVNKDALRAVVLVGSISARIGTPGFSTYAATKGALISAARSLAVEFAPKVRVNTISPGAIETPGNRILFQDPEAKERMKASYPLGLGSTADIAAAVSFLISDEARWITGHDLVVDGGRSLL